MALGTLSPEEYAQQQGLNRQQQMATLLMQQGMQQPQGQMVSGRYVPTSFFQNILPIAQMYAGKSMAEQADTEQAKLAAAIRQNKNLAEQKISNLAFGTPDVPTEMSGPYTGNVPMPVAIQAGQKPDLMGALREINSPTNYYNAGSDIKPMIYKQMMPELTPEERKYKAAIADGSFKGGFNDFQNQMNSFQKAHLNILAGNQAQSKVPMGYRITQNGGLEPIPGGPADQKAQTVNSGRETVDTLIVGLKDQYTKLKESKGITSTENTLSNIPAYLSSTGAGQTTGKLFGTENQSARNTISQSRPLLLQAIKNATGMSAKQMDSNAELKMYLAAATDPSLDYESNMKALNQLETLYGIGGKAFVSNNTLPSASDIDAEIARRKKKP